MSGEESGYLDLVRENPDFRRLWIGNVVSLLGDWFNTIALYVLVNELTGSPLALGVVFIAKMLPWALASPLAGILVDRLDRRRVMIGADLLRAVVVLGFLLVDQAREIPLLYALTAVQVVIGATFEPARSAALPNVVRSSQLVTANTLMSVTWSLMLALGAGLGGFVTEWAGVRAVFLINSLTYLVSAVFILRASIPQSTESFRPTGILHQAAEGILAGWRHLRENPPISRIAVVKATWSLPAGGLVYMLALLGAEIDPGAQAVGIGILLTARGIGTGVGPVIARRVFVDESRWPAVLTLCIAMSGLTYVVVGVVPWNYALVLLVLLAHLGGGTQWVFSTVLLQHRTQDQFRGRVFATEWLLLMLADSLSIFVASVLLEATILDLRSAFLCFGVFAVVCGLGWGALAIPKELHDGEAARAMGAREESVAGGS